MQGRKHAMWNMSSADYWMECDHWYQHKKRRLADGTFVEEDSDASLRGTALHDIIEGAVERWVGLQDLDDEFREKEMDQLAAWVDAQLCTTQARLEWSEADLEDAADQFSIAFRAVRLMLADMPNASVALELVVPLSHERESSGYIDLVAVDETGVYFVDHKFGRIRVEPDCYQLKGYAVNGIKKLEEAGFEGLRKLPIYLGVNQPREQREIIWHETTWKELDAFETRIWETVRRQDKGKGLRAPASLSTCHFCDFRMGCSARSELVGGMLATVEEIAAAVEKKEAIEPELIERIVRDRKTIEQVIEECVTRVKEDEETYPNWKRVAVVNPRKWNMEVMDLNEIMRELRSVGVQNPLTLMSPAQVVSMAPEAKEKVFELTVDMGHHIRLKYLPPAGGDGKAVEASPTDAKGEIACSVRRPPPPSFVERVQAAMTPKGPTIIEHNEDDAPRDNAEIADEIAAAAIAPKKRGRPRKVKTDEPVGEKKGSRAEKKMLAEAKKEILAKVKSTGRKGKK